MHEGELIARIEEQRHRRRCAHPAAANVHVAETNLALGERSSTQAEIAFSFFEALGEKNIISDSSRESRRGSFSPRRALRLPLTEPPSPRRRPISAPPKWPSGRPWRRSRAARSTASVLDAARQRGRHDFTPFSQAVDSKGAVVTIADMDSLKWKPTWRSRRISASTSGNWSRSSLTRSRRAFRGVVSRMVPTVDRAKASTLVKARSPVA